jgi:hypothetical protein
VELPYPFAWWRDSLWWLKSDLDTRIPAGHAAFFNSSPYTRFGYSSFDRAVRAIERLSVPRRNALKTYLFEANRGLVQKFFRELRATLDRQIERIVLVPLHGREQEFHSLLAAISFVQDYNENASHDGAFRKYELIIVYTNGDKIDAFFKEKERAIEFLNYVGGA